VDVLIFLLGGVDFLLFLLLAALQVAVHVHVAALLKQLAEVSLAEVAALADQAGVLVLGEFQELLEGGDGDLLASAVDLVQPNAHVANYIKKYLINSAFNIN
jgi:hypothetical protein